MKENALTTLGKTIDIVAKDDEKFNKYPGRAFLRKRKLPSDVTLQLIINMGGRSLNVELRDNFPNLEQRMTASAFVQRRALIKPEVFHYILTKFNRTLMNPETVNGLRVLAIDGSDFNLPTNPNSRFYIKNHYIRKDGQEAKGTCLLHANFAYDTLNRQFIDCEIGKNERDTAITMMDRLPQGKFIVTMDRGYSGFNMIEHGNRSGNYYVIRTPDTATIKEIAELPDRELDRDIEVRVSTNSQQWCKTYNYRHINVHKDKKEEYSAKTGASRWDFEDKCIVKFRVVKFQINDPESDKPTWEVLVTNLPRFLFSIKDLKELYHMRWRIEVGIRELKYAIEAISFHSKKDEFVIQELYANLVIYNAIARMTKQLSIRHKNTKYPYAINFTMAAYIFMDYFTPYNKAPPEDIYAEMERYRLPVRSGRHDKRRLRPKSAICFIYRLA